MVTTAKPYYNKCGGSLIILNITINNNNLSYLNNNLLQYLDMYKILDSDIGHFA